MKLLKRIKKWPKWLKISVVSFIFILVCARIALPFIVKKYVNEAINELEGYSGYVEDIDIAIYRGAYAINGLHIYSDDMGKNVPLLECQSVDLSVLWSAIFKGRIVGEVIIEKAIVNFENKKAAKDANNFDKVEPEDWRKLVKDIMPLTVNFVQFNNCQVHFIDKTTKPNVDIYFADVNGKVTNLTNVEKNGKTLFAKFDVTAKAMKSAPTKLYGSFDPYDPKITMDMNFEMRNLAVPKVNDYLLAYTFVDAEKGSLDFFAELAVKKGICKGYLKPLIKDLKIVSLKEDKFPNIVWQGIVGGLSKIVENWRHDDQIATKIPIEGDINAPNAKVWPTIRELFKNMFVRALTSNLDNDVTLEDAGSSAKKEKKGWFHFGKK